MCDGRHITVLPPVKGNQGGKPAFAEKLASSENWLSNSSTNLAKLAEQVYPGAFRLTPCQPWTAIRVLRRECYRHLVMVCAIGRRSSDRTATKQKVADLGAILRDGPFALMRAQLRQRTQPKPVLDRQFVHCVFKH
ncbi:hypothetical protein LJR254_001892 [Rhizobium sp. LjRoot254]